MKSMVFCDIDGTLLNDALQITPKTLSAIRTLMRRQIPFVIVSARGPGGIRPLLSIYDLHCAMICYSGALILDEDGRILDHCGFSIKKAMEVVETAESFRESCTWNVYAKEQWIVKDPADPRVRKEEQIVRARAKQGSLADVTGKVSKILLMTRPDAMPSIEKTMKEQFPELSIAKSNATLLEMMAAGIDKVGAVRKMAGIYNVPLEAVAAFGDNYNDEAMLKAVGHGFLMGNAPQALKQRILLHTLDNNHDGIAHALEIIGMV